MDLALEFQARITVLETLLKDSQELIVQLQLENKLLKEELAKLHDKLGLNSRNSSLPPSRDIYRTKTKNRLKSNKKPGAQMGHKAHKRALMAADETVTCKLTSMVCSCGGQNKKAYAWFFEYNDKNSGYYTSY